MNKKGHHEQGPAPYVGIVSALVLGAVYGVAKVRSIYQARQEKENQEKGELEKRIEDA
jgi:hypothetical protein